MRLFTLTLLAGTSLAMVLTSTHAETNELDGASIYWGTAGSTLGEHYVLPPAAPRWLTATFKAGGHFITNVPAWYVATEQAGEEQASLYLMLDREALGESDLFLEVELLSSPRASLFVDLAGADDETIATNVVGELALDHDELIRVAAALPVSKASKASFIRLRHHGAGDLAVTETTLLRIPVGTDIDEALASLSTVSSAPCPPSCSRRGNEAEISDSPTQTDPPLRLVTSAATEETNTLATASGHVQPSTVPKRLSARVIHVSKSRGRDAFSGKSRAVVLEWTQDAGRLAMVATENVTTNAAGAVPSSAAAVGGYVPSDGPKRSIRAGFERAQPGGTVIVHSGVYRESLRLSGKDVKVRIRGRVVLKDGCDERPADEWAFGQSLTAEPSTNRLQIVNGTTRNEREGE